MLTKEITKKWIIVFTDMKDYTVKSSLMTNLQLSKILSEQEYIINKNVLENKWSIIKSMWDGYMIYFEKWTDALNNALSIKEELVKYNKNKNISLFKIEIRIGIDYWIFIEKKTLLWTDYFWTPINRASRLETITSLNWVFITENVVESIWKNNKDYNLFKLWKKPLKGIIENVEIYELLNSDVNLEEYTKNYIEENIKSKSTVQQEKIEKLIFKVSSIWALISVQPIPLLDIYNLLALQIYLLKEISKIYEIDLTKEESKKILFKIIWIIWINYFIGQSVIWLSKIGLPFIWWYLIMPITFWLTYWSWKVINSYMYYQSIDLVLEDKEIRELFIDNIAKWKEIWKKEKDNIIKIWRKNKDVFVEKIKDIYKKYNLISLYDSVKNNIIK